MSKPVDTNKKAPRSIRFRSRFFQKLARSDEADFVDDFEFLLILSQDELQIILEAAPNVVTSFGRQRIEGEVETLASRLSRPTEDIFRVLRVIRFVLLTFIEEAGEKQEPSLWAADYVDLANRDTGDIDQIAQIAIVLMKLAELTRFSLRSAEASRRVFPFLLDVIATVELRGVFKTDFSQKDAPVNSLDTGTYNSEPIGVTPVASVYLSLDAGEDAMFQVDEVGLRSLIRSLLAVLKDLEALKSISNRPASSDAGK